MPYRPRLFILLTFSLLFVVRCASRGGQEELEERVFQMQTRVLTLETRLRGGAEAQENQGKTLATSHARIDKVSAELQRIQGQIGALEVGVAEGEMPGADPQKQSVAKTLRQVLARLEKLENNQNSLLEAVDKATKKNPSRVAKKKSPRLIKSLGALKKSFSRKRYKEVATSAPSLLKSARNKDKEEVLYLYAESLYKLGRLRDAALKYNEYVEKRHQKYLAHAKMRMGDCFRHLGDQDAAKLYYEELIDQFPKTGEAVKAKERLKKM